MGLLRGFEFLLWISGSFFALWVYALATSNLGADPDFEPQYDSEYWVFLITGTLLFWIPAIGINRKLSSESGSFSRGFKIFTYSVISIFAIVLILVVITRSIAIRGIS